MIFRTGANNNISGTRQHVGKMRNCVKRLFFLLIVGWSVTYLCFLAGVMVIKKILLHDKTTGHHPFGLRRGNLSFSRLMGLMDIHGTSLTTTTTTIIINNNNNNLQLTASMLTASRTREVRGNLTRPTNRYGDVIDQDFYTSPKWQSVYLPHLKHPRFVFPRLQVSQGRTNVSILIGIPTVKRPSNHSYVLHTLQNFFDCMTDRERADVLLVVCITEPKDEEFEAKLLGQINERFGKELQEGALEVIAPFPEFYPDFDLVKLSFGDSRTRVNWRSKQNMDYGFLMMYSIGRSKYYLQMEDDISTMPGFVSSINKTVVREASKHWISLSFSQLGYIGFNL